jgi:hypothetical protein
MRDFRTARCNKGSATLRANRAARGSVGHFFQKLNLATFSSSLTEDAAVRLHMTRELVGSGAV